MLPEYIVYLSIPTSIFAGYFYIRDVLRGTTKPNLVSWLIWFIAPTVAALVSLSKGAGLSVLPVLMAGFTPFIVILLAIKKRNAYWVLGLLDYICLLLSLIAIISFLYFKEGTLATICAILADGIAFFPTYIKSWKAPDTETVGPYFSGVFNSILPILTLSALSFNTVGFAIYLLFGNLIEIIIVFIRRASARRI